MNVNNISFGGTFNTREVANIVSGKQYPSQKFMSDITGIHQDVFMSKFDTDLYRAGTTYCTRQIAETHPEFKCLKDISSKIREITANINTAGQIKLKDLEKLFIKREKEIDNVCKQLGETVEIDPINIPFFE